MKNLQKTTEQATPSFCHKGDKQIISEIQDYQRVATLQLPRSLTSSERNNFYFTLLEFGLKTSSQTVKQGNQSTLQFMVSASVQHGNGHHLRMQPRNQSVEFRMSDLKNAKEFRNWAPASLPPSLSHSHLRTHITSISLMRSTKSRVEKMRAESAKASLSLDSPHDTSNSELLKTDIRRRQKG
jgi:hypothetical protein